MRLMAMGLGLVAAIASGERAAAQDFRADARCLVAYSYVVGVSKDPELTRSATLGALYFLGRMDGPTDRYDIEQAMRDALGEIVGTASEAEVDSRINPEVLRCSEILSARGAALTVAGKALQGK